MAHEGITYACIYLERERERKEERRREREEGREKKREEREEEGYFHVLSALLNTD